MALLNESIDQKKFDVRVLEKNIARGALPAETAQKTIESLPDDAVNAEWVSIEDIANDDSDR